MELSIICVNWNSLDYLRQCITSIYEQTHSVAFEIIVVDNASPEGGVDSLREEFPEITVIKSSENLGFARANNLGYDHSYGEYLLFLNPDTQLVNPAINILLDQIKTLPDAGIVGCTLLNGDLSVQTESIQKFPTVLNQVFDVEWIRLRWPQCALWYIAPLFGSSLTPIKVDVIPGACLFVTRKAFESVGKFSEDYFMYAEDIDLNYKTAQQGYASYYVGGGRVVHYAGKSSRQRKNQWSTVMKFRAMVKLFRKTRGRTYAVTYQIAMGAAALARLTLLILVRPFVSVLFDATRVRCASDKWNAVLKCAIGLTN